MPNWSQVSGIADRFVLMGLTWAVGKGWITSDQIGNYAALVLGILGACYAFYVNRNTNLVKQAASVSGTAVVTTAAIAAATPSLSNVVSNEDMKVVTK